VSDLQDLRATVREIKDKLDIVISALMGNPETPTVPGIVVRLDRLEQVNRIKSRIFWVILGAGVAAFYKYFLL
jgi:hypothetical protein